jgi:hypothetical protein
VSWLRIAMLVCALTALMIPSLVNAEVPGRVLTHNPFSKPSLLAQPNMEAKEKRNAEEEGALELTATLVSYEMPLVIVEGELLSIGEEIRGYRLISVGEGKAIFEKNGRTFTFWVEGNGVEIEQ